MTELQPWMTLARPSRNRHPRDDCIVFDEPTHVYTVNGSSKGITSITTFLHYFFPHFDPDKIITKMMNSPKWPQSKWYPMTREEIKAAWNANGKEASEAGTATHLAVEMAMNDAYDCIPAEVKETKEWEYFVNFWNKYKEIWEPYRTEWEVWDEELKLAGSIDMVFKHRTNGTYAIYDWKRSKEIKMENPFDTGFGPCSQLPDCNYWHYTLQLNMYRYILEKNYGIVISEMALVILHPNNKNYKLIRLNRLEDEIEDMVASRKRALAAGKPGVLFEEESEGGSKKKQTTLDTFVRANPSENTVALFQDD